MSHSEINDGSNLVSLLRKHAREGSTNGYVFQERSGSTRITFGELARRAEAVAQRLRGSHPAAQAAILCYPPGVDFVVGLFGCWMAGLTAVPAYPPRARRTDTRLEAIAGDCADAIVLTTRELLLDKDRLAGQTPALGALPWIETCTALDAADARPTPFPNNRPAVLQYTSGSTAMPKGVVLTHECLAHNLRHMCRVLGLGRNTPGVCWLPAFHDMGLIGNILQAVYCGSTLTLLAPAAVAQDPRCWLQAIGNAKAYISGGPCFAFQHCLDRIRPEERGQFDLSSWRVAYVGAEPINPTVLDRFTEFFASCGFQREAFFPCYGLAECTLMVTGVQPPKVQTFRAASLATRQPIPEDGGRPLVGCGQPLPGLDVCIIDPDTRLPVPPGEIGEIWLSGPSVAAGYWNRPEETVRTFGARRADGFPATYLRTGDLGFLKNELFVTGRLKEMLIIRGRNFYPQDLEDAIATLSPALGYHRGAAFAVDEGSRPRLIMVHEIARGYQPGSGRDLFEQARQVIAGQFDLELDTLVLVRTGSIPRATSGKIQRYETIARFEAGTLEVLDTFTVEHEEPPTRGDAGQVENQSDHAVTAQEIREWLVRRLARQLHRAPNAIDINLPFASFGLDSMAMVNIAGDLEKWLKQPLSETLLYDAPTIARLAQVLAPAVDGTPKMSSSETTSAGPIAIIGLGCRFPQAEGPDQFWKLLRDGRCVIADLPSGRWPFSPPDKLTNQGGFLADVQHFDAGFFGITPREAIYLDPQHRVLLEVAWETLEHAGLAPERLAGSDVGVFVGISTNDYGRLLMAGAAAADAYVASGNALSMAAHRLSYHLDLRGPSMAVDTACSSSLVAVHLACQALRAGDCELALAGGVNLMLAGDISANLAQAQMLSPAGRCKTFDAAADGYVRGEGCALIVLKPLAAALRDGDYVYAVVEGSAVNQDGRSNGITAPNKTAQVNVIRKALRQASRSAADISYVEAHGTGTSLGDPIEFEALAATLGSANAPCALGAVKTNLGHLEAAAGIASLLKTVLQLHHGELAPHLHFQQINPLIPLSGSRFHLPLSPEPWPETATGRRAGVSAFGFGGTNAHVIVAEPLLANGDRVAGNEVADAGASLLPLAARTDNALRNLATRYAAWLLDHPEVPLADVCATAAHGRSHFAHRLAVVASSTSELAEALRKAAAGAHREAPARELADRVAFVFTGQGAQYAGMGKKLYAACPIFRDHLNQCATILQANCGWSLLDVLDDETRLQHTDVAQPALFALEYALARTWQAWGIEPVAVLGHSVGEYVAACIAGVFSLEDGLRLIAERGRAMQACPEGSMLACFATQEQVLEIIQPWGERVALAALNGPESIVVAGDPLAIRELHAKMIERGIAARDLRVQRAFHSLLIEPALAGLRQAAAGIEHRAPRLKLMSNLSGDLLSAPPDADYWTRHARQPVRFAEGIRKLHASGITHFLDIGPDPVLARLGQSCLPAGAATWVSSLRRQRDDNGEMLQSLATLYQEGANVRWDAVHARRRPIALPTYPFERQRFWFDGAPRTVSAPAQAAGAVLEWLPLSHWAQPLPRRGTGLDVLPGGLATHTAHLADAPEQLSRLQYFAQARQHFDKLAATYVAQAFADLGWQPRTGEAFGTKELAQQLHIVPRYQRLLERLLVIAGEMGWLELHDSAGRVLDLPAPSAGGANLTQMAQQYPEFEADLRLVHRCGTHLAPVLRGTADPLQILFGDEASGLAERMYERSPVAAFYNDLLKRSVAQVLAQWPAERTIRVLEVGAGTGGTTTHLLPLFPPDKAEYVFSDVSPLFLAQAREKFKDFGHLQYQLLDLESPPGSQGFADHQFDLILASNVLHATGDLRLCLRNIHKMLAPAGLLVLLEGTRPTRLLDLIFGLTEGWWKYTDTDLRPNYPLLSPERWRKLLQEEHFPDVATLPANAGATDVDQTVILARAALVTEAQRSTAQAGVNGATPDSNTWLVVSNGSPLVPLVAQHLRERSQRVVVWEQDATNVEPDTLGSSKVQTVVFGDSLPAALRERSTFTWFVTCGQAPLRTGPVVGSPWTAARLAQAQPASCLIDLDPAQAPEMQAQCLIVALRYPDDQSAVVFRGDQRFIPWRLAAPTPPSAEPVKLAGLTRADLEALPPDERRLRLESYLRSEFAGVAGLVLSREDMERPLQALGLDSLMALQFRNRLEANLGVTLSIVDFLKGLSLTQLVENTLRQLAATDTAGQVAPVSPTTPDPVVAAESVKNLSEGELDSLLQAFLK